MSRIICLFLLFVPFLPGLAQDSPSPFAEALERAESFLDAEDFDEARKWIDRAAERDRNSLEMWGLRVRWAEAVNDRDEIVYALHRQLRLSIAQKAPRKAQRELRQRLETVDPIAPDLLDLKALFVKRLHVLAKAYEKEGRPHSAIRVHKEIMALDPEFTESEEAIERISSIPDPSLADTAKPKDLFADVSEEWIRKFDAKHDSWEDRAKLVRDNYITYSDAGYEVLLQAAEAMEQMSAFYRIFFQYGSEEDGRSVPRINLHIFRDRDEYLTLGIGPPVEWSGGHFTGSAVETYIGNGGFEGMVTTLFHEAAHQFIALATNAVGWLNEGLACFFEGCRILPNGTVLMNMPANHRLFPLAERMEGGWMSDHMDGMNADDLADSNPEKAPTFRILLENKYGWGPAWYAPTWGLSFFLYNYQDDLDGRFIYRASFREFIDKSGGRVGEGAIRNFEEVVLGNPSKPTKGFGSSKKKDLALPLTVEELDPVWKEWILRLRDEESGKVKLRRPYLDWARNAITRGDLDDAQEFFEKGLVEYSGSIDLLLEFADFLASRRKNTDRASKLVHQAIHILEFQEKVDEKAIRKAEKLLAKWDPKWRALSRIHDELWSTARGLAQRYLAEGLPMMTMDVSWRLGTALGDPEIFRFFEKGVRQAQKSLWIWELAYNENNLDGWVTSGTGTFSPEGPDLISQFETYDPERFDYQFLTLDRVTFGDFSLEAEVLSRTGENTFCGLVFGRKSDQMFHGLIYFPRPIDTSTGGVTRARKGFVDLTSFYGSNNYQIWRHNSVDSRGGGWHKLKIDVTGRFVDVWFDDELVVTQEFSNLDVLRGSFGLITGVGSARYRNIRFLARPPRDPGARIERAIRMEKLEVLAQSTGGSIGGSWLGQVPPWLRNVIWVNDQRKGWDDSGPAPTLLVFWNRKQNKLIPLNGWLDYMAERYAAAGLNIISVAAPEDREGIDQYLASHPFPGSVCVDVYKGKGYGATFEDYAIQRFNVPRLLLLDIDHKVVWEGDPGFLLGKGWKKGLESYVEPPLNDLVKRKKLKTLFKWRTAWAEDGRPALAAGDLEAVLPLLERAKEIEGVDTPELTEAREVLDMLQTTMGSMEAVAVTLSRNEGEPALSVLLDWGELLGRTFDSRTETALRPFLKSKRAVAWLRAVDLMEKTRKKLKPGREIPALEAMIAKLEKIEEWQSEVFQLRDDLTAALADGGVDAALEVMDRAAGIPASWLAREYFRW